jgi:hypothetical protein
MQRMSTRLTASRLRQDIYRILDSVLETGVPVEIERRGKVLKIVPPEERSKLDSLPRRDCLRTDPEEIVHIDWSETWKPGPV